jgi:photoactive yellow protein
MELMHLDTRLEFGQRHIDNVLAGISPEKIDQLPFGAIQLDATGVVLLYNAAESKITGRQPKDVVGRHFFNEIAPCCDTSVFRGTFDDGVRSGHVNTIFTYIFDYRMNPTKVKVHMRKAMATDTYWIFVKRI